MNVYFHKDGKLVESGISDLIPQIGWMVVLPSKVKGIVTRIQAIYGKSDRIHIFLK